ncbi:MAG: ankyrin repeat domain-containing protein, partial [Planctomycetota bacterium]
DTLAALRLSADLNCIDYPVPKYNVSRGSNSIQIQMQELSIVDLCCIYGDRKTIKFLKEAGFWGSCLDDVPYLVHAASSGNTLVAEVFIEKGEDVNKVDPSSGWTALHFAISSNELEYARVLLAAGADPNTQAYDLQTPLFNARSPEAVDLLVNHGAKVEHKDSDGWTAFDRFRDAGKVSLAKAIDFSYVGRSDTTDREQYRVNMGGVLPSNFVLEHTDDL